MAGYIGSGASVVSSGAERKKVFDITTNTTSLTGLNYTVGKVHVYHNGVRLVDGTDYTATNSTSITLTVAAVSGDQVVVVSYASYQVALSGIDDQSNAVALTIDSSENVLIGRTSSSGFTTSSGSAHFPNGSIFATVDGGQALNLSRLTSDGSIAGFYKDGTSVGSVGIQGTGFYIDGEAEHAGIRFGGSAVVPRHNNADSNNYVNLGDSSTRFKDAYLSGGIYLGGVGSANKLDDFETGTYVSNLRTQTGGNLSMGMNKFSYTKIGNLVHVGGRINIANQSVSGRSGTIKIDWPFAHGAGSDQSHWSSIAATTHGINFDTGAIHLFFETQAGNSYGTLYQQFDNSPWSYLDGSALKGDASEWIYIQGSYRTS